MCIDRARDARNPPAHNEWGLRATFKYRDKELVAVGAGRNGAVVELYDALWEISASPVVAINRALAVAEIHGASVALGELTKIATDIRVAQITTLLGSTG